MYLPKSSASYQGRFSDGLPPQTVRKLFLTFCHSPFLCPVLLLYSCLYPLYLLKHLDYDVFPPLSKLTFEFSDGLPYDFVNFRHSAFSILYSIFLLITHSNLPASIQKRRDFSSLRFITYPSIPQSKYHIPPA